MSVPIDVSDEVLSGEAVAIDVQPVGFLLRALGAAIDMLLGYAVFILWLFLRIWLLDAGVLSDATDRIATVAAIVVSFVVLPITMEVTLKGRSLGKLAVGGRIVRVDGGAAGFRHAFIRALLGVLEIYMTFGGIAVLTGAFTARSQRLGDLVAGTYSQRVRTPALPTHVPVLPPALAGWAQRNWWKGYIWRMSEVRGAKGRPGLVYVEALERSSGSGPVGQGGKEAVLESISVYEVDPNGKIVGLHVYDHRPR